MTPAPLEVPTVPTTGAWEASHDVARRYARRRPGFTLIGYREVALPLWRLNLNVLTLARRDLPPIQEFVLRSMDAGLRSTPRIAGFLGLDAQIVVGSLSELLSADLIVALAKNADRDAAFALTEKGQTVVVDCKLTVPETRHYPMFFDGLLQRLVPPGPVGGVRPRDLEALGLQEIPAFPADPPEASDLDLAQLVRLQEMLVGGRDVPREFLEIQSIEGNRERQFKPSVALIYEAEDTGQRQVAFVVDGRMSEEHETAFAAAEGMRKLGVLEKIRTTAAPYEETIPEEVRALALSSEDVEVMRATTDSLRQRAEQAADQLTSVDGDEDVAGVLLAELEDVRARLAAAEATFEGIQVRQLEVYEHPDLLQAALTESQSRLLIVSPWIRAAVVNEKFIKAIESALGRGVEVFIGYGLGADDGASDRDRAAEESMLGLASRFETFRAKRLGDTHAKVLVVDEKFVVVTSFNWLSFKGDRNRAFRDERGLYVTLPETIQEVFASLSSQITAGSE
jgi:hypothetical protein